MPAIPINQTALFPFFANLFNNPNTHFVNCMNKKPIIYLYPEKPMDISVQLNLKNSKLTIAYPKFNKKIPGKLM